MIYQDVQYGVACACLLMKRCVSLALEKYVGLSRAPAQSNGNWYLSMLIHDVD